MMAGAMAVVALPTVIVLSTITNGWALKIMWDWFIVSVFHLPSLTVAQAIGVAYVISFTTKQESHTKSETPGVDLFMSIIGKPALFLAFGWILVKFIERTA